MWHAEVWLMKNVSGEMLEVLSKEHTPKAEWDIIQGFLARPDVPRYDVLEWVFTKLPGYVSTRVWAGGEIYNQNRNHWKELISNLVSSVDADDRDTAISSIRTIGDTDCFDMVKILLHDKEVYIQLEAIELLREYYPSEANSVLIELLHHNEDWVRKAAQEIDGQKLGQLNEE
jgi:hypothetical protein